MVKSRTSSQPLKRRARSFSRYKRSETSRLVRGVIDAGLPVRGIEVDPDTGKLRVLVGEPDEPAANPWDAETTKLQAKATNK
jgi:hypothetical protein